MVVQSIALPKVSGSTREHELALVPAEPAAVPDALGGGFHARTLITLLVVSQTVWFALLWYGLVRILL
jgi:hypothetical protein